MAVLTKDEQIEALKAALTEHAEVLEKIKEAPHVFGTVITADDDRVVVTSPSAGVTEVARPPNVPVTALRPGTTVKILGQTGQIVQVGSTFEPFGSVVVVSKVLKEGLIEIESPGGGQAAVSYDPRAMKLEPGHRVVLNLTGHFALWDLGKPATEYVRQETGVDWDDIVGLASVREQIEEIVELPLLHADTYKAYGYKPPKGILLAGPPGCGKTMIGKATATLIQKLYGGKHKGGFISVKGPELIDKYVGESEKAIRSVFARARQFFRESGLPAVVFIDEAESLLSRRGSGVSSDIEKTIVPSFLTEMDGMDEAGALVMLATNRPDRLDSAVIRDGRVDRKITVPRPSQEMVRDIVALNLNGLPGACDKVFDHAAKEIFSKERAQYVIEVLTDPTRDPDDPKFGETRKEIMPMSAMISGAMAANLARLTASNAMRRAIKARKLKNIELTDVERGISMIHEEMNTVAHIEEILQFVAENKLPAVKVTRAKDAEPTSIINFKDHQRGPTGVVH